MAAQSATDRRRALELLAGSARQGCTGVLADMVRAGLATAQIEPRDIWIVAHIGD
jgi:predicted ATPase